LERSRLEQLQEASPRRLHIAGIFKWLIIVVALILAAGSVYQLSMTVWGTHHYPPRGELDRLESICDSGSSQACQPAEVRYPKNVLLGRIVGGLAGDHHIVHMTFAQACPTDAHEPGLLVQVVEIAASAVAHARLQPADHLIKNHGN
jgi:hypothetical protein